MCVCSVFSQDIRFWALFLSFLCGAGSGLVVINNVASLADSLEMASGSLLVRETGSTPAALPHGWKRRLCFYSAARLGWLSLFMTLAIKATFYFFVWPTKLAKDKERGKKCPPFSSFVLLFYRKCPHPLVLLRRSRYQSLE